MAFEEYRRGLMEAFHVANMINANRQGRTAEETCSSIVRTLAEMVNSGEAPAAPSVAAQDERGAFEKALRETWQMVDPLNPPPAGSYYRGQHEGIIAALKTIRENFERAIVAQPVEQTRACEPTRHQFAFAALDEAAKICDAVAERFSEEPHVQYAADLAAQEIRILSTQWQEVAAAQPALVAAANKSPVVLDDERAHPFAELCAMLPADVNWGDSLTPDIARHIARAASPQATATLPAAFVNGYELRNMLPDDESAGADRTPGIQRTQSQFRDTPLYAAAQPAQTERALTDEQIMLLADDAGIPADETCPDTVLLKFARALLTAAQPASGGDQQQAQEG
jgi:hypothetical protein